MPNTIRRVIERFPGQADTITKLADESAAFQSICEDYEMGLATLHRFETQVSINHERIAEYRALLLDLEREIERALAKVGHSGEPTGNG